MRPDDDAALLADILISARLVRSFAYGRSRSDLDDDLQLQFAVRKAIEVVGEASSRLSDDVRGELSGVPWRDIIGMRHRLVHDYGRVNLDLVWEVVSVDIDLLIAAIEPILEPPDR
jgi:uncharacterized protein with HEPN domain